MYISETIGWLLSMIMLTLTTLLFIIQPNTQPLYAVYSSAMVITFMLLVIKSNRRRNVEYKEPKVWIMDYPSYNIRPKGI